MCFGLQALLPPRLRLEEVGGGSSVMKPGLSSDTVDVGVSGGCGDVPVLCGVCMAAVATDKGLEAGPVTEMGARSVDACTHGPSVELNILESRFESLPVECPMMSMDDIDVKQVWLVVMSVPASS